MSVLVDDGNGYRRADVVWLEGDHLCSALRQRGWAARQAVLTEEAWARPALQALAAWAPQVAVVPAALFAGFSTGSTFAAVATIGRALSF